MKYDPDNYEPESFWRFIKSYPWHFMLLALVFIFLGGLALIELA